MGDLIRELSDPRSLPLKWVDNGDGSFSPAVSASITGSGGSGVDREIVVTPYRVKTAFTGASVNDTVTSIRVLDVTTTPTTVGPTLWYNETTQTALASAPSTANLEPISTTGLTNAQLISAIAALSRETYSAVTILSLTTSTTGATFVAFGALACTSLDLVNVSAVDVEYQRGGAGATMTVPAGSSRLIQGITNANQIGVRRSDNNNAQVVVKAEGYAL